MANVWTYILVEALTMGTSQRDDLFDDMRAIVGQDNSNPPFINHNVLRPDGDAIILEALFDENEIDVQALRDTIGGVFATLPASVGALTDNQGTYGQETVYSFPDGVIDRSRYIIFGWDNGFADHESSRQAAIAYMIANGWYPS